MTLVALVVAPVAMVIHSFHDSGHGFLWLWVIASMALVLTVVMTSHGCVYYSCVLAMASVAVVGDFCGCGMWPPMSPIVSLWL